MSDADDLVEVRMLVPRGALVQPAPAPELVSQANALEAFGLPPRRFLEIVRSPRFPGRVLRSGRLRLVRPADLLAHLERGAESEHEAEPPPEPSSLVERLGLEAVRGRAGGR